MHITLVSLDNWGFNKYIVDALKKKGHNVTHVNFNKYDYFYQNLFHRIHNFLLKTFFKKNLKTIYNGKKVLENLREINENNQIQDVILVIKADHIDPKSIIEMKKYGKKTIAFFNDNTVRCPKIIQVIPFFDEVYSFEKADCIKYNLKFATNWIYTIATNKNSSNFKYEVFNITSKDQRLKTLTKIAKKLQLKGISYKIFVYSKVHSEKKTSIEFITNHISLEEINDYINKSKVLLDINRKHQNGLTFRVFESMGLEKKLITTNIDIVNYDFYNPNNILVIDEKNPDIPITFFEKEYEKIPAEIFYKYTVNGWIENVIYNSIKITFQQQTD